MHLPEGLHRSSCFGSVIGEGSILGSSVAAEHTAQCVSRDGFFDHHVDVALKFLAVQALR